MAFVRRRGLVGGSKCRLKAGGTFPLGLLPPTCPVRSACLPGESGDTVWLRLSPRCSFFVHSLYLETTNGRDPTALLGASTSCRFVHWENQLPPNYLGGVN